MESAPFFFVYAGLRRTAPSEAPMAGRVGGPGAPLWGCPEAPTAGRMGGPEAPSEGCPEGPLGYL